MKKAAVIVAPGFEEGETLSIIDIIRRANFQCDMIGFEKDVAGAHDIIVKCDSVLNDEVIDYDMIILPGGYPGAANLRDNTRFKYNGTKKQVYLCHMCSSDCFRKGGITKRKKLYCLCGIRAKNKTRKLLI